LEALVNGQMMTAPSQEGRNKKQVLLAIGSYPPIHSGSGLRAHRTYKEVMELIPVEMTALASSGRTCRPGWRNHEGVGVYELEPCRNWLHCAYRFLRFLRQNRHRGYDLIHTMGQSDITRGVGLVALLLGTPLICELTIYQRRPSRLSATGLLDMLLLQRARLAITLSDPIKALYLSQGVRSERIWERPNPVEGEAFIPGEAADRLQNRRKLGFADDHVVHLVLGRFGPRKNQLLAVKALHRLPDEHRLILAGPILNGDDDYFSQVQARINRSGLRERVCLIAKRVRDVVSLYQAADCCWVPSIREGLPNVMLEALCCGVFVIANANLGLSDHVQDGYNGYEVSCSAEAFAHASLKLAPFVRHHDLRRRFADQARQKYDAKALNAAFAGRIERILMLK
jgi:glycosyltransferase involved in cell wall biosynthesis